MFPALTTADRLVESGDDIRVSQVKDRQVTDRFMLVGGVGDLCFVVSLRPTARDDDVM